MDRTKIWENLQQAADREEFTAAWLAVQCYLIPGCLQGVLVLKDQTAGSYLPVASWPAKGDFERLTDILNRSISEKEGMLVQLAAPEGEKAGADRRYALGYPVIVDGVLCGTVAIEVAAPADDFLRRAMEGLQWGAAWLENMFRREQGVEEKRIVKRLTAAVDILSVVLAEENFQGAVTAFVTELATKLACDRVSFGLVQGNRVRVRAISHTAIVREKMNLVHAIGAAMEEAVMQRTEILYPPPAGAEALVVRDHELMVQTQGAKSILTIPLYVQDRYYAALTLERADDRPFTDEDLAYIKSVAALAGPGLENKYRNNRPIALTVFEALKKQSVKVFGAGYAGRKIALIAVVLLIAFFALAKEEYRITANAVLEGSITRSVVVPQDGYIKESFVKAGNTIRENGTLCTLDERELQLERQSWVSKRNQYERQYQEALAKHDRAAASIVSAQFDQAKAQIALVENKLAQTVIRAPFAGVVIKGDLSQRLGGAVSKGEEIFQIAPLDSYRLILKVDEKRIADLSEGQKGALVLSSLSQKSFPFRVKKITPITIAEEGSNYFRVEADLEEASPRLRPGMEGVGKVSIDRRLIISVWTRDMIDWLRIRLWSWLP